MSDNRIQVDARLSKSNINKYLNTALNKYSNHKISIDGFEIIISKSDNETFALNASQKTVFCIIPVHFKFIKPAGLFTIEGEGHLNIHLAIQCDIDSQFNLSTHTSLTDYSWISVPVIHVGDINVPIETITNCLIKHFKDEVLIKLDQNIAETVKLLTYIDDTLNLYGRNYQIYKKPDLYLNAQINKIQSDIFKESENDIQLKLWVEMDCGINDDPLSHIPTSLPSFAWHKVIANDHHQHIDVLISYAGIAKIFAAELNGSELGGKKFNVTGIYIRKTDFVELKVHLLEPIKGIATIRFIPRFDREDQKIYADHISIDIHADHILYRISSPVIEKIILSRIESMLPIDLLPFLKKMTDNIPDIKLMQDSVTVVPSFQNLAIDDIQTTSDGAKCILKLQNPKVNIKT
jgi:hypothetical protein